MLAIYIFFLIGNHFCLSILKREEIWVVCKLAIAQIGTITEIKQSMRSHIVRIDGRSNSNRVMRLDPDFSLLKWETGEAKFKEIVFLVFLSVQILNGKISWGFFMASRGGVGSSEQGKRLQYLFLYIGV